MKNLMNQGHHLHHHNANHVLHGHSTSHQISHAHVYTLAGNPPNVVDLTSSSSLSNNNVGSENNLRRNNALTEKKKKTNKIIKRPWSKQSRAIRNATVQDITAQGMIRSASNSSYASDIIMGNNTAVSAVSHPNNSSAGFKRLWRGVQTMFVGCIPAHALYFSSYEIIKSMCTDGGGGGHHHQQQQQQQIGDDNVQHNIEQQKHEGHVGHDTLSTTQAMLAGGVATLLHDIVMTPMDTMKQRMQLGHYDNLRHAFVSIVYGDATTTNAAASTTISGGEGWRGLYRSLPITVMTNVPYGMIMMTTNEWLRGVLEDGLYGVHQYDDQHHQHEENPFHFATILLSGMGAGTIASAATAPLDRVKTRLQTQRMGMVLPSAGGGVSSATSTATTSSQAAIMEERALAAAQGKPVVCPKMAVQDVKRTLFPSSSSASSSSTIPSSIPRAIQQGTSQQQQQTLAKTPFNKTYYTTPFEAFQSILQEEGPRGLFRGTLPRVALHAPSVAISWTAYEMAKDWLVWAQQ